MPFRIIEGNIVTMRTDAIVNAANTDLRQGGGVCGAIFAAAGEEALSAACAELGGCETGEAVLTPGFRLPARYVIHTPGPVWQGGTEGEEKLLAACYTNALSLAAAHGCASIAFPLISSGVYGFPQARALTVAVSAIGAYLLTHEDIDVTLVLLERAPAHELLSASRSFAISRYLDRAALPYTAPPEPFHSEDRPVAHTHHAPLFNVPYGKADAMGEPFPEAPKEPEAPSPFRDAESGEVPFLPCESRRPTASHVQASRPFRDEALGETPFLSDEKRRRLADVLGNTEASFSVHVLRLIDERGLKDAAVYKRANIDRKLFSKIRTDPQYRPSRMTAIALAIALKLNLDETRDLLQKAGYALSRSNQFDLIVEYFIMEGNYDIFEINEALFAYGENLLGA